MSAGEFFELEGRLSRRCAVCGVEISVVRPPRPLPASTSAKTRKHLGAELRRQILFELTCTGDPTRGEEGCRDWWNRAIQRCEEGVGKRERRGATLRAWREGFASAPQQD
jgi:hypothetical protein